MNCLCVYFVVGRNTCHICLVFALLSYIEKPKKKKKSQIMILFFNISLFKRENMNKQNFTPN